MVRIGQSPRIAKALRLVAAGAVSEVPSRSFSVIGDNDTYIVTCAGNDITCSCPYVAREDEPDINCSHIIAVVLHITDTDPDDDPAAIFKGRDA